MSEEHLDEAFASLEDVPIRQLQLTAEALERRKDSLRQFASIFRKVADAREGGWDNSLARFHLGQAVDHADDEFAEQIGEARFPFWQHVLKAVEAREEGS